MKPNCRRICDLLTQYADGTLGDEQRAEVQRHLDACPPCRVIAGQECGARQLLRACADRLRGAEPLPPGLRSRCHAASRGAAGAHANDLCYRARPTRRHDMGRGDNHRTPKMRRKKAQRKLKARTKQRVETTKATAKKAAPAPTPKKK